jgi:hypothetical protein
VGGCGRNSYGSGYGQVVGCCENGNKPSGSIKVGEFLACLDYSWLKRILPHEGLHNY